jgi:hypothetical protein
MVEIKDMHSDLSSMSAATNWKQGCWMANLLALKRFETIWQEHK